MKLIKKFDYMFEIRRALAKTDYDCCRYEPNLRWANDKIGMPESCWDYFHQLAIDFITSTREWKDIGK